MLVLCPECELQVSDKAITCPHCGYPMKEPRPHKSYTSRKKRLPNGFGQISEIKGRNLRKPYRARSRLAFRRSEKNKVKCRSRGVGVI